MTAFHTIAVPHEDILAGRLTMDVFAADLWEVHQGRAPDEYKDPARFFQKTYQTEGLTYLLDVVAKRLQGQGGDPVIQIQTPFGGGKTHALIAMYHKAAEWGADRAVIVGTPMAPTQTIWGLLAEQLRGTQAGFEGLTAPGREILRMLLSHHQPLLMLMDEVLEYATKAAGVQVGDSTLAAQTLAFLQELTEAAATLDRVCLAVTLPSSTLEHYDEGAEKAFQQLQRVAGRVEKIYTPVQEHEIASVIRRRLFASVDEKKMRQVTGSYLDYAVREGLLPAGVEPSEYRSRFEVSYPFLPEVVDILYQRWGSFPSFQRTRGVLRLLSLLVYALRERELAYVSLADFDLANQEIRRELLKHIGPEYDSVIALDITGRDAGARKVDTELGAAYQGLRLGTRVANTLFLYSFSGGVERGATLAEVKRAATTTSNPATAVAEAVELLKETYLFHLRHESGRYFFTSEPNITRYRQVREENVTPPQIAEEEEALLKQRLGGKRLKVFPWPESDADIPDTPDLKLIVLRQKDDPLMQRFLKQKGATPRVHCNTLIFLVALEGERLPFEALIRKALAWALVDGDKTLNLNAEDRKEVKDALKKTRADLADSVRRTYRQLFLPARDGIKSLDMGIPTYGEDRPLDEEVYQRLRLEGEILEQLAPRVIKELYLRDRDYVLTEQLAQAGLRTPGEPRVVSREAWEGGIAAGVSQGLFGLGVLENDQPVCQYFKEPPLVGLVGSEVIIRADICQAQREAAKPPEVYHPAKGQEGSQAKEGGEQGKGETTEGDDKDHVIPPGAKQHLRLKFIVPKGKVSGLMGLMNLLQSKFNRMELILTTDQGQITDQDYEDKVRETFRQMGIDVTEE